MAEECATPDLAELMRRHFEAPDFDAAMSFFAPDAVYDNGDALLRALSPARRALRPGYQPVRDGRPLATRSAPSTRKSTVMTAPLC